MLLVLVLLIVKFLLLKVQMEPIGLKLTMGIFFSIAAGEILKSPVQATLEDELTSVHLIIPLAQLPLL